MCLTLAGGLCPNNVWQEQLDICISLSFTPYYATSSVAIFSLVINHVTLSFLFLPIKTSQDEYETSDPSPESFSITCEEEINVAENKNHEFHGVSARELERKLHELLETRQQERIAELESAIEEAEKKLQEKEMELQCWKETQAGRFTK